MIELLGFVRTIIFPVVVLHRVTMTMMTRMLTADLTDGSKTSALGLELGNGNQHLIDQHQWGYKNSHDRVARICENHHISSSSFAPCYDDYDDTDADS